VPTTEDDCEKHAETEKFIKTADNIDFIADGYAAGDPSAYDETGEWDEIPVVAGTVCAYGNYCITGTSAICPPGLFCHQGKIADDLSDTGLGNYADYQCDEGFYCEGQAKSRRPRF
jgi:hypothetical protein